MVQLDLNKIVCLTVLVIISLLGHSQNPVTLQFTGQDQYGQHVPLSTVTVENVTKHWQEVLYYPDTTLIMGTTGIEDGGWIGDGVRLFQNTPNPFDGVTDFALHLPEASAVTLEICDLNGKEAATYHGSLDPGSHLFRAWLVSPQTYLLQARTSDGSVQIKMVNTGNGGQSRMEYLGKDDTHWAGKSGGDDKGSTDMPFSPGDWMMYVGDVHLAGTDFTSDPVLQMQNGSELITLPFNLPLPTVTTEAATNITPTEAKLNGLVVETSGYPVFSRGFLITDNAQLVGASDYTDGAGGGSFHYEVSGLQMGTRYYYRAYARTALGTTFGDILYFDTQSDLPEVHTFMVTDTGVHWANCGGNVTFDGGSAVTARGVCWSTTQNPTVNDMHTTNGTGIGSFASHIAGLHSDTTYYVRAYATNSVGTAYGEERSFTTLQSTATGPFYCGIDSVYDFDGNVYPTVEIGQQCWMKEDMRTTHYEDGTPIDPNHYLSGICGNSYAYKVYTWVAMMRDADGSNSNPSGVQGICPTGWHVPSAAEIIQLTDHVKSKSGYHCNGDSNSIGKALASSCGWSLFLPTPDRTCCIAFNSIYNNATGFSAIPANSSSGFTFRLWSTTQIIQIYDTLARVWEIQTEGHEGLNSTSQDDYCSVRCILDYSNVDGNNAILPVVNVEMVEDITSTSAICRSQVLTKGGAVVTASGICWGTTPNPTISDNFSTDSNGTNGYVSNLMGLTPGTTYYVRAFATNSVGTAYSIQKSFTTTHPVSPFGNTILIDAQTCPGTDVVTDYEGNTYHTVQIGQQCWMKENLRTRHYSDGTPVSWWAVPVDDGDLLPLHGCFYNWSAVMYNDSSSSANPSGVQGICPDGWHIPSHAEWVQLITYVNSMSQYQCGSDSNNIIWALITPNLWCNIFSPYYHCGANNAVINFNSTGFSAFLTGHYTTWTYDYASCGYFWTSTLNTNNAFVFKLSCSYEHINLSVHNNEYGASVRCLRD
jgi:uncharacterized protein (TIGR02145 family)